MTDEEMILRGWRRCAVGQRTTQYCGQVQKAVAAERERVAFEMVNEAQRAVQEAVAAEREALCRWIETMFASYERADNIVAAIRAGGEK